MASHRAHETGERTHPGMNKGPLAPDVPTRGRTMRLPASASTHGCTAAGSSQPVHTVDPRAPVRVATAAATTTGAAAATTVASAHLALGRPLVGVVLRVRSGGFRARLRDGTGWRERACTLTSKMVWKLDTAAAGR